MAVHLRLQPDAVRHHLPRPGGRLRLRRPRHRAERLERLERRADRLAAPQSRADWPTFRADNAGTARPQATSRPVPAKLWESSMPTGVTPTAPTAAGGLVFVGGSDGIVRALDAARGKPVDGVHGWRDPSARRRSRRGRALRRVGRRLGLRFEARPGECSGASARRRPSGGSPSTGNCSRPGPPRAACWSTTASPTSPPASSTTTAPTSTPSTPRPAGSTGRTTAPATSIPQARTGVSGQGQLLLHDGTLYLAGGNVVSPAGLRPRDVGKSLNDPANHVRRMHNNNVPVRKARAAAQLYRIGNQVFVSGKPYCYLNSTGLRLVGPWITTCWPPRSDDRDLALLNKTKLVGFATGQANQTDALAQVRQERKSRA